MKKTISFLLCALLIAALLPSGVFAADEQLYFVNGSNHVTALQTPCGGGGPLAFAVSDGNGDYTALDSNWSMWTANADGNNPGCMGVFTWSTGFNQFVWDTNSAYPGTGKIFARQGDQGPVYSMDARLDIPEVGVYLDADGNEFCPGGSVNFTIGTVKTVYLKTRDGFTFTDVPTGLPEGLTAQKTSDKLVTLTLSASVTNSFNVGLTCPVSNGSDSMNRNVMVRFEPQYPQTQLYFRANDGRMFPSIQTTCGGGGPLTFTVSDGNGGYTALDSSWSMWTADADGNNPGCMGVFTWNTGFNQFVWDTNSAYPGTGKIFARQGDQGPVYSMDARLDIPEVGVYLDADGNEFCPGGSVNFTLGTVKTVYLKTRDGFTFTDVPTGLPEGLTAQKTSDKLVTLTLSASVTNSFNAGLTCPVSNGSDSMNRNVMVRFEPQYPQTQLYFRANDGRMFPSIQTTCGGGGPLTFTVSDGNGGYTALDSSWSMWTADADGNNPGYMGVFTWNTDFNQFLWETNAAYPGTGKVFARQGDQGPVYSMSAKLDQPDIGVYLDENGTQYCPGSVEYAVGTAKTVFLRTRDGITITAVPTGLPEGLTADLTSDKMVTLTLTDSASGTVSANLSCFLNYEGNQTVEKHISVSFTELPASGLCVLSNQQELHSLEMFSGDGMPLDFYIRSGSSLSPLTDSFTLTLTEGRGVLVTNQRPIIWSTPADYTEPGLGTITATNGTESYSIPVAVGVPAHAPATEEVLPKEIRNNLYREDGIEYNDELFVPAPFTYNGNTYYLGATWLGGPDNDLGSWGGMSPSEDVTIRIPLVADFYTYSAMFGYTPVDEQTRAILNEQFSGTLAINFFVEMPEQTFPAVMPAARPGYACAVDYILAKEAAGRIFSITTGTIEGHDLLTVGMMIYSPLHEETHTFYSVEEINTFLAEAAASQNTKALYNIYMGTNEMTGKIIVPAFNGESDVNIYGKGFGTDQSSGPRGTTLTGGIEANDHLFLTGVDLVGKGKNVEEDNVGLSGSGIVQYYACSFTGFWHAVESVRGMRFGGRGCTFRDNNVGLSFATEPGYKDGGNFTMDGFLFENNNIGIEIWHFTEGIPVYAYQIERTVFRNNIKDIVIHTDEYFFAPGNLFEHGGAVSTSAEAKTYSEGKVSLFPVATDESFASYNYEDNDVLVCNELIARYKIPQSALDNMKITVVSCTPNKTQKIGSWSYK